MLLYSRLGRIALSEIARIELPADVVLHIARERHVVPHGPHPHIADHRPIRLALDHRIAVADVTNGGDLLVDEGVIIGAAHLPRMKAPRQRIAGNREQNGPVGIAIVADDEASCGEDHGGRKYPVTRLRRFSYPLEPNEA